MPRDGAAGPRREQRRCRADCPCAGGRRTAAHPSRPEKCIRTSESPCSSRTHTPSARPEPAIGNDRAAAARRHDARRRRPQAGLDFHGRAELDRYPACVPHRKRASLMRSLEPFGRQTGIAEECFRLVEVLLRENPHADALGLRLAARLFKDEAVMTCLRDAAQVDRALVLVADDETDEVDIEASACGEILYRPHRNKPRADSTLASE